MFQSIVVKPWVLLTAVLALFVGCAGPTQLPDQQIPYQAGEHRPGSFIWHDLLTADAEAAQAFYGPLLGWEFEPRERTVLIRLNGEPVGSLVAVEPRQGQAVARWIASVSVADVDAAVATLEAAGGVVHEPPYNVANRGRLAFVSDPQGAQLTLLRTRLGDPVPAATLAHGAWLWDELWTDSPADSLAFYQQLAPYQAQAYPGSYTVLSIDGQWRAGMRAVFRPELEQRWVPVVRVNSVEQTVGLAGNLGGRVVLQTSAGEDEEATALLADPQGALFIVQEWSDAGIQEVAQ